MRGKNRRPVLVRRQGQHPSALRASPKFELRDSPTTRRIEGAGSVSTGRSDRTAGRPRHFADRLVTTEPRRELVASNPTNGPDYAADVRVAAARGIKIMPIASSGLDDQGEYIFRQLAQIRDRLADRLGRPLPEISMGMSHDFEIAVEEGATEVRVGTALFGPRESA